MNSKILSPDQTDGAKKPNDPDITASELTSSFQVHFTPPIAAQSDSNAEAMHAFFLKARLQVERLLLSVSEKKPVSASEDSCSFTVSNRTCELIETILVSLAELEEINVEKDVFTESLMDIQRDVLKRKGEKPEFQRFAIIRQSLEMLQNYFRMDYAGIWMIKGSEMIALHESGRLHPRFSPMVLNQQFEAAIEFTKNGNLAHLCPSDSEDGGVDAVLVFRNSENEPIGFLLLDDHYTKNEIPDRKLGALIKIFYDRLKAFVYEEQVILVKQENATIIQRLKDMENKLIAAHYDKLTGLLLREHADLQFEKSFERTKRNRQYGCFCVLDVDKFKSINDTLGHLVGDMVLQKIGDLLKNGHVSSDFPYFPRKSDIVCRWGGEEFALYFEETDANGGKVVAERIREAIESFEFETSDWSKFRVTVTIGISEINPKNSADQTTTLSAYFQRADDAMYSGKVWWRNQVVVYRDDMAKAKNAR